MKQKTAAMEMSLGTVVILVLMMTMLILGLVLVQKIFTGATESVDSINDQVRSEIDNLFNAENKDLIVSLGAKQTANVKQGTRDFGFVMGFSPDDPTELTKNNCYYGIEAFEGEHYCERLSGWSTAKIEDWFITGTKNVEFSEIQRSVGYELIKLKIPEDIPLCTQRFKLEVKCPGSNPVSTYFDINIVKKGFF